ncbi:Snf7 family [Globomyces pollinis-pini]|nr:Snf7 family [Globomyces pollinis-pini]KAJ2992498.1 hypothetical protein HDV02_003041 [Globomyces sp. JEL0801]
MNRIFGSTKPSQPKPTISDAISKTDERADAVLVKVRKLDAELLRYKDQMQTLRDGPAKNNIKQKAVRLLKQKKMYESQLEQLQQQSFNMEQAAMTTENLKNTMITLDAMQSANKELKKQYKQINIDKIEQVQDELEDLLDATADIQEALGRSYGVPDMDEDELEAELDALGDDLLFDEVEPSYLPEPDLVAPTVPAQEMPGGFVKPDPVPQSNLNSIS